MKTKVLCLLCLLFCVWFTFLSYFATTKVQITVLGAWSAIATLGWLGMWRSIRQGVYVKKPKKARKIGRHLATGVLVAAMGIAPMQKAEARPDDTRDGSVIAQCICVLVVGGVVCWGIWKMCSRIPQPPPAELQPPPPTNYPPVSVNPTNRPPHIKRNLPKTSGGITSRDISQYHMADPVSGGEFHTYWFTQMQTSGDLVNWRESLSVTGYVSDAGQYIGFWTNGQCAFNAYVLPGSESYIPVEQGTGDEPQKWFRAVVP